MKKLVIAAVATAVMTACSGEREYLNYEGLSMGMSAKAFVDSLKARGLQLDTAATDETMTVLNNGNGNFMVTVAQKNDTIIAVQEDYTATYNDSTRELWQQKRDALAEELDVMPGANLHGEDHKEALFETSKGCISVILLNRSYPSVTIKYENETREEKREKK